MLKAAVRTVALLLARRARASRAPCQREVRTESVLFLWDVEPCQSFVHGSSQRSQFRTALNSHPKHSRRPHTRKESITATTHFKRACLNRLQRASDLSTLVLGFLPDELQSDVQRFGPHPARIRRKPVYAVEKSGDAAANNIDYIE